MNSLRTTPIDKVNIIIEFESPPTDDITNLQQINGGIKILVDGKVLTQYENEEELTSKYGVNYEYKGEQIVPLMRNLVRGGIKYLQSDINIDQGTEWRCEIYGTLSYIVYSWISNEYLRIAFQVESASPDFSAPLWVAFGVPVRHETFCEALIDGTQVLCDYISQTGIETDTTDTFQEFKSNLSTLKTIR